MKTNEADQEGKNLEGYSRCIECGYTEAGDLRGKLCPNCKNSDEFDYYDPPYIDR